MSERERLCWSNDLPGGSYVCICDNVIVSLRYTTGEWLIIGGSCHKYFCRDKRRVLLQQKCACHDKSFVVTKLCLLRRAYFCCDKTFVVTNTCLS